MVGMKRREEEKGSNKGMVKGNPPVKFLDDLPCWPSQSYRVYSVAADDSELLSLCCNQWAASVDCLVWRRPMMIARSFSLPNSDSDRAWDKLCRWEEESLHVLNTKIFWTRHKTCSAMNMDITAQPWDCARRYCLALSIYKLFLFHHYKLFCGPLRPATGCNCRAEAVLRGSQGGGGGARPPVRTLPQMCPPRH